MLDRTLSIRLDVEQLHAIEQINADIAKSRPKGWQPEPGKKNVRSASDVARELIRLGLLVHTRDEDFLTDVFNETFGDQLKMILASAVTDQRTLKILKKIAATAKAEPDFG
jgi:hypothetical protein